MPKYPGFIGPGYTSQSRIADVERTVNWYPEKIESGIGKVDWALYPVPGFVEVLELEDAPVRGLYSLNGRTFAVSGTKLYEILADWTAVERGTGINNLDDSPASMVSNGDGGHQLFITSGSKGYIFDLNTSVFSMVLDGASQAGFIDGFFLALDPQTSTLKISELEDGLTWDATQVAQRNAGADRWAGMICSHKEIWLFGSLTTEVWYNDGSSPFPFAPNPAVFINYGILAPASVAILDNAPMWLGQSSDGVGVVYRANGYAPQRVSNHALEYRLSTFSTLLDAHAWTYQDQGHSFYILTFPTAQETWVYDAATGAWHERGSWNGLRFVGSPVWQHTYAFAKHLVGGRVSGRVYEQAIPRLVDGVWTFSNDADEL